MPKFLYDLDTVYVRNLKVWKLELREPIESGRHLLMNRSHYVSWTGSKFLHFCETHLFAYWSFLQLVRLHPYSFPQGREK